MSTGSRGYLRRRGVTLGGGSRYHEDNVQITKPLTITQGPPHLLHRPEAIPATVLDSGKLIESVSLFSLTYSVVGHATAKFLALPNPLSQDILVVDALLNIKANAGGSRTLDIGVGATTVGGTSDNLFDGADISTNAILNTADSGGTNGGRLVAWAAGNFLVADKGGSAGTPANFRGVLTLVCQALSAKAAAKIAAELA